MSNQNNHSEHLTLVQIKNYLEDRLDPKTRHKVERHLLDCEFCKDAFEGYQLMGIEDAEVEVRRIKRVLSHRISDGSSFIEKYRYYSIAASVLILLGAVFLVFEVQSPTEELIVQSTEEQPKEELSGEISALPDSVPLAENDAAIEKFDKPSGNTDPVIETTPVPLSSTTPTPQPEEQPPVIAETRTAAPPADEPIRESSRVLSDLQTAKELEAGGDDADAHGLDFAEELIASEDFEETEVQEAPTDAFGAFADENISSTNQALSTERYAARKSASEGPSFTTDPQPENGLVLYQEYLANNMIYPDEAKANNVEGEVEIQFRVGVAGDLSEFQVIRPLGYGCDEEAVRLLKEGPSWSPATADGRPIAETYRMVVSFTLE